MNVFQDKLKNATKALINRMVTQDSEEWPPTCLILAYQPVRPECKEDTSVVDKAGK